MPGQKPQELDALLREFLEADAHRRAKGVTLETVYDAVRKIANDRLEDRKIIDAHGKRLDRHGRRIESLEEEVERLSQASEGPDWSPARENTGQHDLAVLKKEHDEMREEDRWARRQRWTVIGTIFAALLVATISGCVTYAVTHLDPNPPAQKR